MIYRLLWNRTVEVGSRTTAITTTLTTSPTALSIADRRHADRPSTTPSRLDERIRALLRDHQQPDQLIAELLNRLGRRTSKGNSWTMKRVCSFGSARDIAVYREGERQERGELILTEAAERLAVDHTVVRRLIRSGVLPARQACKGAPWIIREDDIRRPEVLARITQPSPLTPHPNQQHLTFSTT